MPLTDLPAWSTLRTQGPLRAPGPSQPIRVLPHKVPGTLMPEPRGTLEGGSSRGDRGAKARSSLASPRARWALCTEPHGPAASPSRCRTGHSQCTERRVPPSKRQGHRCHRCHVSVPTTPHVKCPRATPPPGQPGPGALAPQGARGAAALPRRRERKVWTGHLHPPASPRREDEARGKGRCV